MWPACLVFIAENGDTPDCERGKHAWDILDALQTKITEDAASGNITECEARYAGDVESLWYEVSPRWGKAPPPEPPKNRYHPSPLPELVSPGTNLSEPDTCSIQ